ncbi:hypothetical protein ACIBH1_34290 [Nonomuraea sp. NPDC050663]|uniref:hypothetical protein n=1 Tax=Nonomuraea sp. NPDC050663 TaxID=3364370 RepID=UPI0037B5C597
MRRLAAAGAVTAFVIGGLNLALGVGIASAETAERSPLAAATCLIPLLPCDGASGGGVHPEDPWQPPAQDPGAIPPNPFESWSDAPAPQDSWSSAPGETESGEPEPTNPWKPVDEGKRKVPDGAPQTGGGGLAPESPTWPFVVGASGLLAGAGLAGFAVRRRRGDA